MAEPWSRAPKLSLWKGEGEGMGRTYVLPGSEERFPSVTTVLKHEDKSHLIGWATKIVAEKARDRTDIVMGDPDKVVDRLRYAHNEFRDERGWVGSGVHAAIDAEATDSWDFPSLDREQQAMLDQWHHFCDVYEVEILLSEFTVYGDGYAGTADAIIKYTDPMTGERITALVDYKTSKALHDTYRMQLGALANANFMMREVDEGDPDSLLRKGKTKRENSWWKREDMPYFEQVAMIHIREDFCYIEEVEHVQEYYEGFRAYLSVHEAKLAIKEAVKNG